MRGEDDGGSQQGGAEGKNRLGPSYQGYKVQALEPVAIGIVAEDSDRGDQDDPPGGPALAGISQFGDRFHYRPCPEPDPQKPADE